MWLWCSGIGERERERESMVLPPSIVLILGQIWAIQVTLLFVASFARTKLYFSFAVYLYSLMLSSTLQWVISTWDLDDGNGTNISTPVSRLVKFVMHSGLGRFLVLFVGMPQLTWMNWSFSFGRVGRLYCASTVSFFFPKHTGGAAYHYMKKTNTVSCHADSG